MCYNLIYLAKFDFNFVFIAEALAVFESPVLDEWPQHLNNLKIEHTKTKENMEFLGTIVEYLTVSEMDCHTL